MDTIIENDIFALSGDMLQNWMQGFVGAIFTQTLYYPMGTNYILWFVFAWLTLYIRDPLPANVHYHSSQPLMLVLGALQGVLFARVLRLPVLLNIQISKTPWPTVLYFSLLLTFCGAWTLFTLIPNLTIINDLMQPFASTRVTVIVGVVLTLLGVLLAVWAIVFLWRSLEGISTLKYVVVYLLFFVSNYFIRQAWWISVLGMVGIYGVMYLWSKFVAKRSDVFFPRVKGARTWTFGPLERFVVYTFVQHFVMHTIANQIQGCYLRADRSLCSADEAHVIMLSILAPLSLVASFIFLCYIFVVAIVRQNRRKRRSKTDL